MTAKGTPRRLSRKMKKRLRRKPDLRKLDRELVGPLLSFDFDRALRVLWEASAPERDAAMRTSDLFMRGIRR